MTGTAQETPQDDTDRSKQTDPLGAAAACGVNTLSIARRERPIKATLQPLRLAP